MNFTGRSKGSDLPQSICAMGMYKNDSASN
jgi:hypothetical protein